MIEFERVGAIASAVIGVAAALLVAGCTTPLRLNAVPFAQQDRAVVPGMAGMRYRPPAVAGLVGDVQESIRRERAALQAAGHRGPLPPSNYLAISGGGEDGAFGAGLLVGWTEHGDRPEFKLVTGVSTGALMAPFAFLGRRYDPELKRLYTTISTADIMTPRAYVAAFFDDAMADNSPLRQLVERTITAEILEAIAVESARGRILLIATTDLDARRAVIWNVTQIAASRHPQALPLIQRIMVASAAIPGAFPPVMIDVEVDGKRYQEMHVDGGTTAQVFVLPPEFEVNEIARRQRTIYIVRNARLDAEWAEVERNTLTIAGRAIQSLIQTQGIGDLYQIYVLSLRDKEAFRLAFVPETFKLVPKEPFDRAYMNALFQLGYDLGRKGYEWDTVPPGYAHR